MVEHSSIKTQESVRNDSIAHNSSSSSAPASSYAEEINRVLFAIADAVNTTEDLNELYKTIHMVLGGVIDVTNFYIAIVDSKQRTLYFPYHVDTVDQVYPSISDFDTSTSLTGLLVEERKPLLLRSEALQHRAAQNGLRGSQPLVWMGSPLFIRDEVIGVIAVQSYTDGLLYNESDLQILVAVSHQIAVAIDRKRFLDKLQKSEEQYRELVENANSIILRMDGQGRILFINEFAQRFFGYTADEIIGRNVVGTILQAADPATTDLHALTDFIGNLSELHTTYEFENIRCDGKHAWISWTNKPSFTAAGEIVDILCVGNDITEQKVLEKALQEKNQEFERYFNLSLDLLCIATTNGHFVKVNSQWQKSLGYSEDELVGKSFLDLVHPDDIETTLHEMARLEDRKNSEYFQNRYRCKDGSYRWIEWCSRAPENHFIYAVARDITDRKKAEKELQQSEETFRNIVHASPMGIHMYELLDNDRLVFIGANPAADKMLGVDNANFVGMTLEDAFPPLKETEIPYRYRRAALYGEYWRTEQITYSDGEISGAFEVYVFQMSQGKVAVLFNDITERKQQEVEKTKLQQQLTQAQKMESVGRLAGGVAHDFNNMLGVILGHADLALQRLESDTPLYASLQAISKAARHSANLTKQLLAFARKQTVAPQVLDLNETVSGMLSMLRRLIGEDIELAWLPGETTGMVKIDPTQIDQILVNLSINARDAITGTGKITIETGTAVLDKLYCSTHSSLVPGDYVLLVVTDNGCGMAQETKAQLFEPFFTTKEVGKGTGLGLATVYGIVKQNSGLIHVDSEPGQGTTFTIYLPKHTANTVPQKTSNTIAAEEPGDETILLVEDEQMILDMTTIMLEQQGYTVLTAVTPGDAIRLAREYTGKIHLLITDVVMPEMNGKDLAKNLLSLHPNLKSLFMSGYTADVIAHHGVLDEGVHFIQKPFSLADLSRKVRDVLMIDLA